MIPPKKPMNYEKVKTGDFVFGEIFEIEYDNTHTFKGFQGKEDTVQPGVRLAFKLDGCKYLHKTRWMKFSYHEKAGLYKNFVSKLVEGATPGMSFDLDGIKGMKVKTIWSDNGDFQNIENIFPLDRKVVHVEVADHPGVNDDSVELDSTDSTPF